ncbi:MAG: hypothetical protein QXT45_03905 [Candidatus Bilamarchaeaceae archaeon]
MKRLFFILTILMVVSVASAKGLEECVEYCCISNGGTLENDHCRDVAPNVYSGCISDCVGEEYEGGLCCGPTVILLLLGGVIVANEAYKK